MAGRWRWAWPGDAPISTLTRCRLGDTRLEEAKGMFWWASDLILAMVGVMGSVLAWESGDAVMAAAGDLPSATVLVSALTLCEEDLE